MSLKHVVVLAVLVAAAVASEQVDFVNDLDHNLNFECPAGEVIKSIYSVHDDSTQDRRFKFGCGPPPKKVEPIKCEWTEGFVNHWDGPVMFMCPPNHLVAGVSSVHDNNYQDRRMKFKCCRKPSFRTQSCYFTDYLNNWNDPLDYTVPSGRVLAGWLSVHDNSAEDRRHRMVECRYGKNK
ncbi:hemagglutinin/amebocyte aggregation factor [Elysia marginata]|uniref:Hemagglutinin/amebocyte aggregation factor n=1 Tax=Elysia marginata TaxID=1093978 RepID=A0AAV4HB77_9GAST|nr:hemagglutinin/amebocyte aggregation factor [Elysia marginata]